MKRSTLFILNLLILCSVLSAQSEKTLRSTFFDNATHAITADNGDVIILNQQYPNSPKVYRTDSDGAILNQYPVDAVGNGPLYTIEGMALGTDNSVFITGKEGGCDYVGNQVLMKFHITGILLWVVDLDSDNSFGNRQYTHSLKTAPDGGVYLLTSPAFQQEWVRYSSDGNFEVDNIIGELDTDYNPDNGDFIYFTYSQLVYTDASTDTAYQANIYPSGGGVKFLANGEILSFQTNNTLERYDNQLNQLASVQINDLFSTGDFGESIAPSITSDGEYIYIAKPTQPAKLLRLDYNLQVINQIDWEIGDDIKALTATTAGYFNIIGNDYHHTYFRSISNNFNFSNTNPDIGVVDILNANVKVNCSYNPFCYYGGCRYTIKNIEVIVKNFGTEPITFYEVNALYSNDCPMYCNEGVSPYMQTYTTVNALTNNNLLLPGEQDTIKFSDMSLELADGSPDLCFYTTRPNQKVDKNRDNDNKCSNIETFLPIELLVPLEAKIDNQNVLLTWKTATETNNSGFEIQKSSDGVNWSRIGWQDGQGTSLTPHSYTHIDENLLSGTNYYRFKQVDFDGKFIYSNVAIVSYEDRGIRLYPNPVKNALYFSDLNGAEIQHIIIYDQTGRTALQANDVQDSINVSTLPTGVYMVEIATQGGVLYEKIMVE